MNNTQHSRSRKRLPILAAFSAILVFFVEAGMAETYGDPSTPLAGRVYDTEIHTTDPEEFRYVVLDQLTTHYADEQGIKVSGDEISAYTGYQEESVQGDIAEQQALRDELTARLESQDLAEGERSEIQGQLDDANQTLEALAGMQADSEGMSDEDREAHEQIATAYIRQLKINQALYAQYGGRIAWQQGGAEPYDAYRMFLEERQKKGDFEIADGGFETGFWSYYRNDENFDFYPSGSDEEKHAFDAPWESH